MAHKINDMLDRIEGKTQELCDKHCKNFHFPNLERACVLSGVYSVKQGEMCFIKESLRDSGEKK